MRIVFFYLVFFVGAIVLSLLINGLFLKFSRTLGVKNQQEPIIRWGSQAKPALGGISFFILFLFSITIFSTYFKELNESLDKRFLGFLLACTLGFLIGLADDAYNTNPLLKFIGQFICCIILIYSGIYIQLFNNIWLNYIITIFWIVGMMNSINMLDNMDAITASVSSFILLALIVYFIIANTFPSIFLIIAIGVLGSIIGFLFYNWNPSRIYMGDTGSQFLGVFLAAIGIMFFWNASDWNGTYYVSKQILNIALVFALPIIDTTTVSINRIRRGQSPFVGGKDHTTHHLSYKGYKDFQVALIFIGFSLLLLFFYITLNFIKNWNNYWVMFYAIPFVLIFLYLYLPTIKKNK